MQDLILGASARISHLVSSESAFVVSDVSCYIHDAEGEPVVNGGAGEDDNDDPDTKHEAYYLWEPASAGRYTYQLFYTIGAQTLVAVGEIVVHPRTSPAYPYVWRVRDWLVTHGEGEFSHALSIQDFLNGLNVATRAYSQANPALVWDDIALLNSTVEYDLPAAWEPEFSRIARALYKPDATSRTDLKPYEYETDDTLGTIRLLTISPSMGQTLSLRFQTRHQVSHAADTVKGAATTAAAGPDFEAVTMYAAGVLLAGELGNQASQSEASEVAAQVVSYRDQQQRRRQQGQDLMARAVALWTREAAPSQFAAQRAQGPSFAFGVASGQRGR